MELHWTNQQRIKKILLFGSQLLISFIKMHDGGKTMRHRLRATIGFHRKMVGTHDLQSLKPATKPINWLRGIG